MAHFKNFQTIASAQLGERVPKVAGAWYFGLPFRMDDTVTWANYFGGVEPRAFLVGVRDADHAEAGRAYPLDVATIQAGLDPAATQAAIDAADAEAARFIGFAIEGTEYETDANMTVALAAGIPEQYVQQDQTLPAYTIDPAVAAVIDAGKLPITRLKKHLFWNTVQ